MSPNAAAMENPRTAAGTSPPSQETLRLNALIAQASSIAAEVAPQLPPEHHRALAGYYILEIIRFSKSESAGCSSAGRQPWG